MQIIKFSIIRFFLQRTSSKLCSFVFPSYGLHCNVQTTNLLASGYDLCT